MSGNEDHMAYGHYYQGQGQGQQGQESTRGDASGGGSTRALLGNTFKSFRDKYKEHSSHGQGQQGQQGQYSQTQGQGQGQQQYNPQGGYPGQSPPPQGSGQQSMFHSSHGGTQDQQYQQQQYPQQQQQQQQGYYSNPSGNPPYQSSTGPNTGGKPPKQDLVSGLMGKIQGMGSEFAQKIGSNLDPQAYATYGSAAATGGKIRYGSFAPERERSDAKWYVDGCSYMWAVSRALETARESIWILDWWLSPELYLRRPPAKNEQYRIDRMLQAAAQRGVKVNIIVYKEVTQALSLSSHHTKHHLEDLHQNISVFRHPDHLPDRQTIHSGVVSSLQNMTLNPAGVAKLSADALKGVYGMNDNVILYWAHHEKLCLIDGKIAFMGGLDLCFGRWDTNQHSIADAHPHDIKETVIPGQDYNNARILDFQDVVNWEKNELDRRSSARMGWSDVAVSLHGPVVEDLRRHFVDRWNFIYDEKYAVRQDTRHTKLVLYQRPLSSSGIPGFSHGQHPQQPPPGGYGAPNPQGQQQQQQPPQQPPSGGYGTPSPQPQQQSNTYGSQPAQQNTQVQQQTPTTYGSQPAQQSPQGQHPTSNTYGSQQTQQYPPPPPGPPPQTQGGSGSQPAQPQWSSTPSSPYPGQGQTPGQAPVQSPGQVPGQTPGQTPYFPPPPGQDTSHSQTRGFGGYNEQPSHQGEQSRGLGSLKTDVTKYGNVLRSQLAGQVHLYQDRYLSGQGRPQGQPPVNMGCQIVRSCSKWSHGGETEASVAEAYATIIRESEHFVYIENQFFITSTGDKQKPVQNKIGAAIVERILRAARARQKYQMIIVIPAIPGFPGDLREDGSLGTRAIMEFQYDSINRGGNSIMEMIAKEGFNPMEYIRFYNLRNYDRINVSATMRAAEQQSGVNFGQAQKEHDHGMTGGRTAFDTSTAYPQYQQAAQHVPVTQSGPGRWDSVAECYMLGGEDIRKVPWEHSDALSEIDAFVSEELYVHSKVLIADDRTVIIGSANINDRSQLGTHDSEIAVIIQDPSPLESTMNGQQWPVSRFAATLRRQLCRKHLGLIPPQDYQRPDANFEPVGVPNQYDLNSPEDRAVSDPLSDTFLSLWNSRAKQNTEVFRKVFHAVPDDSVRNWNDYKEFYEYYFRKEDDKNKKGGEQPPESATSPGSPAAPTKYQTGHVIRDEFPGGVKDVKEELSKVKGTLVEMPLMFLIEEDIAKEGLSLNSLTEEIYT